MKPRWFAIILFFAAVILAGWLVGSYFSLESLAEQERSIHNLVAEHPLIAWVLGFFIYVGISLVPGTRGKAIAAGWLFGLWSGLLLVNCALTLAALIGFFIMKKPIKAASVSAQLTRSKPDHKPKSQPAAIAFPRVPGTSDIPT